MCKMDFTFNGIEVILCNFATILVKEKVFHFFLIDLSLSNA